ncbi:MAG TPA: DoxX family membrane protein, partial [Chitinophagaceae bacterium]
MKIMSTKYSAAAFSFAMLLLRLGLGLTMLMAHGLDKLQHYSKYSQAFADPFHIGKITSLSLDIFAEFFCSCLVILGLFTR